MKKKSLENVLSILFLATTLIFKQNIISSAVFSGRENTDCGTPFFRFGQPIMITATEPAVVARTMMVHSGNSFFSMKVATLQLEKSLDPCECVCLSVCTAQIRRETKGHSASERLDSCFFFHFLLI